MKLKIRLRRTGETGEGWWEEYDEPNVTDARAWAEKTIRSFNNTLREHELGRELLEVTVLGKSTAHDWEKTSLMTQSDRLGLYDKMRCRTCGVTAKRFRMTHVKLDSKYRAKKYRDCRWAQ